MKRVVSFVLLIACAQAQSPEDRTKECLDLVLHGEYEKFYALFAPEMKKAVGLREYAAQGDQLQAILGKPTGQGAPSTQQAPQQSTVVTIPVHWKDGDLNFIVSWNKAGQVQGTWFLKPQAAAAPKYETPPYSTPAKFHARNVTIGQDEWKLPGTLLVPEGAGPFAAVVLVHGSGPQDRDESIGGSKVFRDLAEGLATRGVAVLRYDKRTFIHRQKVANEANLTVNEETVTDAVRAAALLRGQTAIDGRRVFVLGHSLGGNMVPRILQADAKLAGAIVMAGNVRPLEELIVEQAEYLFALNGDLTAKQTQQVEALRRDPWQAMPGIPASYRADLKGYNPVELARRSTAPLLILQGGRDYQVTMRDFDLWKAGLAGRPNTSYRSFPALNHLFIAGEGKSTPQEYEGSGHMAGEVVETIAAWITGLGSGK
jgi:uncharacterized protein